MKKDYWDGVSLLKIRGYIKEYAKRNNQNDLWSAQDWFSFYKRQGGKLSYEQIVK